MFEIPVQATTALCALRQAGYEAYLVGGCVRDLLLGEQPKDWDIATVATPKDSIIALSGFKTFETGIKHGTITALVDGLPLEITTFREDIGSSDHRHPDSVVFAKSLKADLARRDFTINALALDESLEIIDYFGGQKDLDAKVINCVGHPDQRFTEDGLRILRAIRFASILGFSIEPKTAAAIHKQKDLLQNISVERVTAELTKTLCGENAGEILLDYADVLCVPIPEIKPMIGFDQNNYHHCYDVWRHTVAAVQNSEPSATLRWAALLHDIGKPGCYSVDEKGLGHFYDHAKLSEQIANTVMRRLKFDNATRKSTLELIVHHDTPIPNSKKAIARYLNRFGEATLRNLLSLQQADNLGQAPEFRHRQEELADVLATLDAVLATRACFSLQDLAVDGTDMIACGLAGKEIGAALSELLNAVMDEQVANQRKELLDYLSII